MPGRGVDYCIALWVLQHVLEAIWASARPPHLLCYWDRLCSKPRKDMMIGTEKTEKLTDEALEAHNVKNMLLHELATISSDLMMEQTWTNAI